MEIRGEEVLLPVSAVSAFPRPHWLQGRVLGSLSEPVWRSHNLRIGYEDACKICSHEQELASMRPVVVGKPVLFLSNDHFAQWELRGAKVYVTTPLYSPESVAQTHESST